MVEKEPSRECALGAYSAFDDRSEGVLGVNEISGILCSLGEPLKPDEVSAIMCEINYMSDGGKVKIDDLIEFLYGKEPLHVYGNNEALGVAQLEFQAKLK